MHAIFLFYIDVESEGASITYFLLVLQMEKQGAFCRDKKDLDLPSNSGSNHLTVCNGSEDGKGMVSTIA